MRSRSVAILFVFLVLIHWPPSAYADIVNFYLFTGANGLSGHFTLDASAGLVITDSDPQLGTSYQLVSPFFSALAGSYGLYSFSGNAGLYIFDLPPSFDGFCCGDQWIVRAGQPVKPSLSGNVVNGRSVTGLNLFIYGSPFLSNPVSLVPPVPSELTPFNFQYSVVFSDGTFDTAALSTLRLDQVALVPEPSTLLLLTIAILGILLMLIIQKLSRGAAIFR